MANKYVYSGAAGAGTGADWTNAYTTLAAALTGAAAGDDLYVAHDHAETQGSAITLTAPGTNTQPNRVMCVSRAGSVPPVSADLATTGSVTTTGAFGITIAGFAYCYGLNFNCGTGASAATLTINSGGSATEWLFDSCHLSLLNTSSTANFTIGSSTGNTRTYTKFTNCVFKFSSTSQLFSCRGPVEYEGCSIDGTGSIPSTLFSPQFNVPIQCMTCDWSALGVSQFIAATALGDIYLIDCKLDPAVNRLLSTASYGGSRVHILRSGSSPLSYTQEEWNFFGQQIIGTTVVRTNGASDGVTPFAWKVTTRSGAKFQNPFRSVPISIYNSTVGSNVSVTVYGIINDATLPKNDEFWLTARYLGSASDPLGSSKSSAKADPLATGAALTASTEAWDSGVTARANNTAYTTVSIIKVASNPGRVFFCTTAGTSDVSEAAGFAAAVDGGSVTDGTAVFRAGCRFSATLTLTSPQPAVAAALRVRMNLARASVDYYVCPKITKA